MCRSEYLAENDLSEMKNRDSFLLVSSYVSTFSRIPCIKHQTFDSIENGLSLFVENIDCHIAFPKRTGIQLNCKSFAASEFATNLRQIDSNSKGASIY